MREIAIATPRLIREVAVVLVSVSLVLAAVFVGANSASAAGRTQGLVCAVPACPTGDTLAVIDAIGATVGRGVASDRASLMIKVTDLPAKTAANVTITGPHGYRRTITASATIAHAAPGTWTIAARPVTVKSRTYYAKTATTIVHFRGTKNVTVNVDFWQIVNDSVRVASGGAIKSVTVTGNTETVVVYDPRHLITAGDVLASAATSAAPGGLLVRVTSVTAQGGTDTIMASPGGLTDAIPRGAFAMHDAAANSTAEALLPVAIPSVTLSCGAGESLVLSGSLTFRPSVSLSADWGGSLFSPRVESASFTVSGTATAALSAQFNFNGSCSASATLPGPALALVAAQIGPLPLVFTPKLSFPIMLALTGKASYTSTVTQSVTLTAGLDYTESAGLHPVATYTHSASSPGFKPSRAVTAALGLDAKLTIIVDALAGPSFLEGAFLNFDGQRAAGSPTCWQLTGGVRAGLGLSIPVLGFDKSNDHLVSAEWDIAHGTCAFDGILPGVACPTSTVCEAVGYTDGINGLPVVLRSTDGGLAWLPQTFPKDFALNDIACLTAERCLAVGSGFTVSQGIIALTSDGGQTWSASVTTAPLDSIACPSSTHCMAVGSDIIAVTANAGASWRTQKPPGGTGLITVACPSVSVCEAPGTVTVGNLPEAVVFRTVNAGKTWTTRKLGYQGWLWGISCPSVTTCLGVGEDIQQNDLTARTTDTGSTWRVSHALPATFNVLTGITCPSVRICLADGGGWDNGLGGIIQTGNGGATWQVQKIPGTPRIAPREIACVSVKTCVVVGGYQVGSLPPVSTATALHTRDGGAHWTSQLPF